MARKARKDGFWSAGATRGANTLTGGMVISRTLQKFGINSVFSLAGASHTFLLDALDRDGFKIVSGRHETATVAQADGFARVTGKLGVALIISDQGMPNAVSGILTAYEACSPVLVIVARLPTSWIEPEAQTDHDALALVRPITKWARTVHSGERLREYVEVAARHALSGRPGPVVLQVPQELLAAAVEAAQELDAPLTETPKAEAPVDAVEAAAELLIKAKRPLIIAGGGATASGAGAALRTLAEAFGIPVFGNALGRGLVPEDDELGWSWPLAQPAAKEADVVLWAGARMTQRLGYGLAPRFAANAKFIQIDVLAEEIGRNRAVDVPIVADAAKAVAAITAELKRRQAKEKAPPTWVKTAVRPRLDFIDTIGLGDKGPIHPYRLARELMKRLPKNAIYVGDGADIQNWMHGILRIRSERGFMDHYPLGSMGIGTPLAIGAAAGARELARTMRTTPRPVIHVTGDGAFGFYPSEYNSAILAGVKITTFISNDGAWGTEKHGQLQAIKRPVNTEFGDVRYDLIGKAFGCHAERVTEPKQVGPAMDRALKSDKAAVVDVVTDPMAGKLRKEDPRVLTIAFSDLVTSRRSQYTVA
ncbi:MAG: thiamine pyrophosphate-binding protein [Alphaproteobacteria bacterium]|nr:thiamine pyrophosphate-binding protein [Alphaproteobacteria bacterium]